MSSTKIPKGKLTPEYLKAYADSQIEAYLSTGPVDERLAERHIIAAYKIAGLAEPTKFEWFDSPSAFVMVWDSVRNSVRNSVWNSVRNSVGDSVGDSVRAWYDAPYNAHAKFFNDNLEKNNLEHMCLFDEMVNGYYLTADTVYIVRKPIRLVRDEGGRLHYDHDKAIEWADGTGFYYLHGVEFKQDEWQKIVDQKLGIKDLEDLGSADKRAVAIQMLRPDRLLRHLNAKLVNTGRKGTRLYEVKNFMDTGDTEYCMRMIHPSIPEREFIEWVEPKVGQKKDADFAQAVAFGVSREFYLLAEEA